MNILARLFRLQFAYRVVGQSVSLSVALVCLVLCVSEVRATLPDSQPPLAWHGAGTRAPWAGAMGGISEYLGEFGGVYRSRVCTYTPPGVKQPVIITGSCAGLIQMIQAEKPEGIDPDFVRGELLRLLQRYYDADTTRGLFSKELVDRAAGQLDAPGHEEGSLLRQMYSPQMVSVSGERWKVTYMLIGYENGIWIQSFEGTLKPFSVRTATTSVLYPNQPYFQAAGLREALRIKNEHADLFTRLPGDSGD